MYIHIWLLIQFIEMFLVQGRSFSFDINENGRLFDKHFFPFVTNSSILLGLTLNNRRLELSNEVLYDSVAQFAL